MKKTNDLGLLLKAISFAAERHRNQMRKDGRTPYVAHPFRVATLVSLEFGVNDPDVLCAAVLHDTIEDTNTDRDDISREFGPEIASWVALLTKDKRMDEKEREEEYFDGLAGSPLQVKLCKLGDTLDNLLDSRSLKRDGQEKAVSKAKKLLAMFAPGFPKQHARALERVREAMRNLASELGTP